MGGAGQARHPQEKLDSILQRPLHPTPQIPLEDKWLSLIIHFTVVGGTPGGKESACQCRKHKGCGFDPCARRIPWSMKRQTTAVFWPGNFHGQESLVGPWAHRELDSTEYHPHTRS